RGVRAGRRRGTAAGGWPDRGVDGTRLDRRGKRARPLRRRPVRKWRSHSWPVLARTRRRASPHQGAGPRGAGGDVVANPVTEPRLQRVVADGRDVEGVGEKDLVEMWRLMRYLRAFDERAVALQRQGRLGTYPIYWGQEGIQVGSALA